MVKIKLLDGMRLTYRKPSNVKCQFCNHHMDNINYLEQVGMGDYDEINMLYCTNCKSTGPKSTV